ncbi:MAG: response regulator [Candidatus Omnitrophica bacterium]|nr:response regulator [Candidatus Omnitrophota bacterium]
MAKKILVVDDEPHIVLLVKSRLKANGFEVVTAENGLMGYEKAKEEHPDLIILDVLMPELNGYETLLKLKSDEETKNIPVIMFTAKSQIEDVEKAQEAGACDYVVKPFSPPVLLGKIKNVLG